MKNSRTESDRSFFSGRSKRPKKVGRFAVPILSDISDQSVTVKGVTENHVEIRDDDQTPDEGRPVVDIHWQRELSDDDLELVWSSLSADLQLDEAGVLRDEFGQSLEDFTADYREASRYAPDCFFITVDLRPHAKINAFLESISNLDVKTQEAYARSLKELLVFAIDCGFSASDCDGSESVGDVFELDFDHYRKFQNENFHLSAKSWNGRNTHCKAFFLYCRNAFQLEPPFALTQGNSKWGPSFDNGFSRKEKRHPAGQPIAPEFVDLLLKSVANIQIQNGRPVGNVPLYHGRDEAILALALATGARRETIRGTTHYEIPELSCFPGTTILNPFTDTRFMVPAATAKKGSGSEAEVFTRHLIVVREWMLSRQNPLMHRPYSPADAIELDAINTNIEVWEGTDLTNKQKVGGYWKDTDMKTRKRLVDDDGQSPLLFTNANGKALSERYLSSVAKTAADNARKKESEFPRVRLHDLRHIYGTYLALYYQSIGEPDPITLVSDSMGHIDPATTRTYTRALAAHRKSGRDINDYLWGCDR